MISLLFTHFSIHKFLAPKQTSEITLALLTIHLTVQLRENYECKHYTLKINEMRQFHRPNYLITFLVILKAHETINTASDGQLEGG